MKTGAIILGNCSKNYSKEIELSKKELALLKPRQFIIKQMTEVIAVMNFRVAIEEWVPLNHV